MKGDSITASGEAEATHSENEWPIFADTSQPKSSSITWKIILLVVIVAAVGAGGFFAYRTYVAPRLSPTQVDPKNSGAATAAGTQSQLQQASQPASGQSAASTVGPPSSGDTTNPQPGQATGSSEGGDGEGMVALQAASSPSEAAAKEFSERLIRSGVPAYVVAADLGQRGKWFRVRVGRFNDRSEAAKFAEQSRLRARAAGINLQLIVVDYEKP